ncbi:MAG: hypothetical protein ACRCXZ_03270 [Patescibacteria group bacterium]
MNNKDIKKYLEFLAFDKAETPVQSLISQAHKKALLSLGFTTESFSNKAQAKRVGAELSKHNLGTCLFDYNGKSKKWKNNLGIILYYPTKSSLKIIETTK